MWISQDERRLLRGYYELLGNLGVEEAFRIDDLARLLAFCGYRNKIPNYEDALPDDAAIHSIVRNRSVEKANGLLAARKLIKATPHDSVNDVVIISLTLDGYDLGRKYSNWLERSGLWFKEYRNHWLWLVFAMVGGGVVGKLVESIWVRVVRH